MFPDKYNLSLKENIFLAKKVLVAQIHNLSRFENCQTTLLQTEQIINGQNVASASLGDIQTILNLKRAYQYVMRHISDGLPVDIPLLKKINSIVAQEDSLAPGDFRTGTVGVTLVDGSRHTPPAMSEVDVQNLLGQIENRSNSTTETAIRSMLAFMRQQIFWDGNKRTATLFANAMLIEKGCGILEISELQMPEFNTKLSDFYRSGDDTDVATYLYQNCIFGIDY
ncbi:Fic family protein [Neisseria subflava]|uniref:Fic family protein n=2 Tax=Neisseria TaxID=482 RepID=A0ABD7EXT8_NEIPE|nr:MULTISPECIES: Fic family protein [Neisseria]MCL5079539.1 Fic family protein [Neisseria perflava]MCL9788348.1 Fic family protein [Neisseria subflava]QXW90653.1 Fic family protein [Neisseria perflava]QXW94069.1 Fic family protein [Neisseria sicca ATCC 29256]